MKPDIVIIGASWGGLHAVGEILGALPAGFPVPVLIVQHRSEDGRDLLADLLDRRGPLPVVEVEDKSEIAPGCIRVAPRGYHVLVEPGHFALSTEGQVHFSRPSIDVALESAADTYGEGVVAVILTGANDDGAEGLAEVRRRGGLAIVQEPGSAERSAMPAAAVLAADPQVVAPLEEIAAVLTGLAETTGERAG